MPVTLLCQASTAISGSMVGVVVGCIVACMFIRVIVLFFLFSLPDRIQHIMSQFLLNTVWTMTIKTAIRWLAPVNIVMPLELTYDVRTLQFNLSTDTFQVQRTCKLHDFYRLIHNKEVLLIHDTALAREFTSLIIDPSDMYLLAGTSSGDFALFGLQNTTFKVCTEAVWWGWRLRNSSLVAQKESLAWKWWATSSSLGRLTISFLTVSSKNGHIKQICRDSNHNWIVESRLGPFPSCVGCHW